jgi:hypothetical protein
VRRHDGSRWLLAGAGIVVVCLSPAACSAPPSTFGVSGKIGATADMVHPNGNCDFAGTTYHKGDEVVLWGADNTLLAIDHLVVGPDTRPGQPGVCDLTFKFDDIRPGDVGYQLTVGPSRKIVVTEDQLRAADFDVTPRGRANQDDPDIEVTAAPSSSPQPKP